MPVPFALLVGISLGALFAWVASPDLAREERPLVTAPAFAIVCGFACLVYAPVMAYFLAFHEDWAWLYLVPGARVPSALDLAATLAAAASVPGAFAIAARMAMARHAQRVVAVGAVPIGIAVVVALATVKRLAASGSYAQIHGGFGVEAIGASTLGRGVLVAWVTLGLGAAWAWRRLRAL